MQNPFEIAVAPGGDLVVANCGRHQLLLSSDNGDQDIRAMGEEKGKELNRPCGVAVDTIEGTIYVADTGNDRIQVFDKGGAFLMIWEKPGELSKPSSLAVHAEKGLIIADTGNHRIRVISLLSLEVKDMRPFKGRGSSEGQFDSPMGVAIDARTGNVIVADTGNKRIQVFDDAGEFIQQVPLDKRSYPSAVAVDAEGNIIVSDGGNHCVLFFSAQGMPLTYLPLTSRVSPLGVAVAPTNGVIHVSCSNNVILTCGVSPPSLFH